MPLGESAIDKGLPATLGAILRQVVEAEHERDRGAVQNVLALLEGLASLPQGATLNEAAARIAEVGLPQFYATQLLRVVVQMAIASELETETEVGGGVKIRVVAIDARFAQTYRAATQSAATIEVHMVPKPPPDFVLPLLEAANAMLPPPPQPPSPPEG